MDNRILLAAEELEALAQTLRSVSSADEAQTIPPIDQASPWRQENGPAETESSPLRPHDWQMHLRLHHSLERDLQVLKDKLAALEKEWRDHREDHLAVVGSEPGPQSPAIMAPSMTPTQEAPSDAELCPICGNHPETGHCPICHLGAQEPDSPPESTDHVIPSSSPSGQLTTQTCLVEPGCACALLSHKPPTTLWQSMQIQGKWERVLRVGCPHCDALWAFVQIVARPVPASPSEST